MENKQTAVEFAEDQLSKLNSAVINMEITTEEYHKQRISLWQRAKIIEKDQSRKDYYGGVRDEMQNIGSDFEDYYKETYGEIE
jgi:hypothetical protein